MVKFSRMLLLALADVIGINVAYLIALLLRFDFDVESSVFAGFLAVYVANMGWITLIKLLIFWLFGLYNSLWKYAGIPELLKVVLAALATLAGVALFLTFTQQLLPRSVQLMAFVLDVFLIGGMRVGFRSVRNLRKPGALNLKAVQEAAKSGSPLERQQVRVMLVGAGDAGASMIKEIKNHQAYGRKAVVAVDDDPAKQGSRIAGVKIAGGRKDIQRLARQYRVDEIIIAIPSAGSKVIQEIINECSKTQCKMKTLPALIDLISDRVSISKLRDVEIEDLLGRDPVQVDLKEISGYLEGRIVMVTGGGGSIGSELCRQIARFRPRKLIALDIYENSVFELTQELRSAWPALELEAVIASVRDRQRMEEIFRRYTPHVVFHAAAHKHVPLMEFNSREAVLNNVLGTENLLELAEDHAVDRFVLISTDKAVNPTNVMGASKRMAEMLMQNKSRNSRTSYSAVRFGNVLGSNGSVLPIFRKQIENGGPVTVTHPEVTRYFMTIPEASQLVIQAGAMANGGEIFILDMGEPMKIMDLAENIIRMSGFTPYVDIDIVVTGLRPGEKLYEELLLDEEGILKTGHDKIYIGKPTPLPEALKRLLDDPEGMERLREDVCKMTDGEARAWLHRMVPNYKEASGKSPDKEG
ncbi:MAG: nucleoside-diphosphate sugar epimerase/dehydratase [Bacillota bacterium]|nr:nucleoside-diphosphate sugar epimerase/dehydratase [Bacillota bacterium]